MRLRSHINAFIFLTLLSLWLPAQNQKKIDSLQAVLLRCKEDTQKVHVLCNLGWETSYQNLRDGLKYSEKARALAVKLNDLKGLALAYHGLGSIYVDLGDFANGNLYLYKELTLIESLKLKHRAGACYVELGILYGSQNNFTKALHYDSLAVSAFKKDNNLHGIAVTDINIGSLYEITGNYQKALIADEEALQINKKTMQWESVATSYCNIGKLYIHLKKYNEALENLQQAYAIYKREKLSYSIPNALSGIGDYYSETDRPEMAIHYYDTALTYVEQNGQKKMKMDIYSSLSESYESLGQYQKAHTYHKLYAAIKDSLFDENKSKELSRNEAKYEFEKLKQADKMADEKKDAIAEQEIMRQRVILYSLGLGFLALLVFAVFILRSYNQKKKINSQLEEVNALIQEKNKSITDSINYAKRIQKAILPSPKAVRHLLPDSFVFLKPKDIVSGDFYWIDKTPGGKVLFTAVDCTGHGVPGAMVSVVGHNNLNRCLKEFHLEQPAQILDKLNDLVKETFENSDDEVKDGMDMALCSYDPTTHVLEYAGANNPLWVFRIGAAEGEVVLELKADKQPIGNYSFRKAFTNHRLQLQKGDCIYIFSDGYADQFGGEKGKKFKYKKLQSLLLSVRHEPMEKQEQILLDTFEVWRSQLEQVDDVLVIGLRV